MNLRIFISMIVLLTTLFFIPGQVVLAVGPTADVLAVDDEAFDAIGEEVTQAPVFGVGRAQLAKFGSDLAEVGNANAAAWANAFATTVAVPSGGGGCVSLRFSSEATAKGTLPWGVQFRAVIGTAVVNNPYVFFDPAHATTTSGSYSLAVFNWWRCGLAPGTYSVYVQFKPYYAGHTAYIRQRTLIIEY